MLTICNIVLQRTVHRSWRHYLFDMIENFMICTLKERSLQKNCTEMGKMQGSYQMENLSTKKIFDVTIPSFEMVVPFKNN